MGGWNGLIYVEEIQHLAPDGKVLWSAKGLKNIFHDAGEELLLKALFVGGKNSNDYIPDSYYFGLDARPSVSATQTMASLVSEPSSNGYARYAISSLEQFQVTNVGGVYQANSPLLSFAASGGPWGPVTTLFMTDKAGSGGVLIASVPLATTLTPAAGAKVVMRMGLRLQDVPTT